MTETLQVDSDSYYRLTEHGWILGMIHQDVDWIAAFLVHSTERGNGYGSDFLSKFENWSNSCKVKEVTVILKEALLADEPTVNFFQHRGYKQDPDILTFFTKVTPIESS